MPQKRDRSRVTQSWIRSASAAGSTGRMHTSPKPSTCRRQTGSVVLAISLLGEPVPFGDDRDQVAAQPVRRLVALVRVAGHAGRSERDDPPAVVASAQVPDVAGGR